MPAGYRDLPAAAFRARAASHSAAPLFGYRLGLDAHNAGVAIEPDSSRLLRRLAGWPQRRADFVNVHNDAIEALVTSRGGVLVSVPDPLPTLATVAPLQMARPFNLLFVCTFSPDEPYLAVLEAARLIDPDIAPTAQATHAPKSTFGPGR